MNNPYPEEYERFRIKPANNFSETYKKLSSEYPFMNVAFIIGIICLLISGFNEIKFDLDYINASVSEYALQQINVFQEPIQTEPSSIKPFVFHTKTKNEYTIIPMADYSISALVVVKNTNVWLRGIMNSDFDNVALIDLGLLCGGIAKPETLKYVRFQSKKILNSARELRPMPTLGKSWSDIDNYLKSNNMSLDYFAAHMSHVHVIPANSNIMSALMQLKKMDLVKLDGYLVDIDFNGLIARTSLSRTDTNETSRGNGACEIMYVTKVQISDRIYE